MPAERNRNAEEMGLHWRAGDSIGRVYTLARPWLPDVARVSPTLPMEMAPCMPNKMEIFTKQNCIGN